MVPLPRYPGLFRPEYSIFPKEMNSIPIGMALFTKDGASLFAAVERNEAEGFWDGIVVPWFDLYVK